MAIRSCPSFLHSLLSFRAASFPQYGGQQAAVFAKGAVRPDPRRTCAAAQTEKCCIAGQADTICFKSVGGSRSAPREGFLLGLEEAVKVVSPGGVAQLAQGLGFDLADALAGHAVQITNFLEGVAAAIDQPKAHFEDVPFPGTEHGQNVLKRLFEHALADSF